MSERRFNRLPDVGLEIRQAGSRRYLEGYGAVFYRRNSPGTEYELWQGVYEHIMPTAFDRAIEENDDVFGLFNHDTNVILGRTSAKTMELSVNRRGLQYSIPIDEDDPDHQRVIRKVGKGELTGSSFMFTIGDESWRKDGDREIREIHSVSRLYDTGPVAMPAYEATSVGFRAKTSEPDEAVLSYMAWKDSLDEKVGAELDMYRRRLAVIKAGF